MKFEAQDTPSGPAVHGNRKIAQNRRKSTRFRALAAKIGPRSEKRPLRGQIGAFFREKRPFLGHIRPKMVPPSPEPSPAPFSRVVHAPARGIDFSRFSAQNRPGTEDFSRKTGNTQENRRDRDRVPDPLVNLKISCFPAKFPFPLRFQPFRALGRAFGAVFGHFWRPEGILCVIFGGDCAIFAQIR